jgi:heme exporter protein CcmD
MTYAGYIAAGYGITFLTLGVYVWRVLARGRALARALPPEERRWR